MKEQKRIKSKRTLRKKKESQDGGESWSSVGHIIPALKYTRSFFLFVNHTLIHHQFSVMLTFVAFSVPEESSISHYTDLKILRPVMLLGQDMLGQENKTYNILYMKIFNNHDPSSVLEIKHFKI